MDWAGATCTAGSAKTSELLADNGEHIVSNTEAIDAVSRSGTAICANLNEHLRRRAMAEESRRRGGRAVGPSAEHRHDIADIRAGHERVVGEPV